MKTVLLIIAILSVVLFANRGALNESVDGSSKGALQYVETGCVNPSISYTGSVSDTTYDTIPIDLQVSGDIDSLHLINISPGINMWFSGTKDSVYINPLGIYTDEPCSVSAYGCGNPTDTVVIPLTSVWDSSKIDSIINGSGTRYTNLDTFYNGDTIDVVGWFGKYFRSFTVPAWLTKYDSSNTSLKMTVNEMGEDSINQKFLVAVCDTHSCDTAADTLVYGDGNPVVITLDPISITDSAGVDTFFYVTVIGDEPISFQWQRKLAGASTYTNVGTDKDSLYDTLEVSENDSRVRCIATNAVNSDTSLDAVVTVLYIPEPPDTSQRRTGRIVPWYKKWRSLEEW